jgi:hypothetical protein
VPNVTKPGSLNFLEPSGPVQDGNGIALPFIVLERYNDITVSLNMHAINLKIS